MAEPNPSGLLRQLEGLGLTHEVFDHDAIAADLAERSELNETLVDLISASDFVADPATFTPGWPE